MQLCNEMLVAHLCQHKLLLFFFFFPQVYKQVQVPWMGNPSVISPFLYLGEWCSSSYWHCLLPSHLLQEEPGQGKAFVYFSPLLWHKLDFSSCTTPPLSLSGAQCLKAARGTDSVSTSVGFHGHPPQWIKQRAVWRRCSSRQHRPAFGMQATAKCWSLLFPFTGCSFQSPVLVLVMHKYKMVTKMQRTCPLVLLFCLLSTTTTL